MDYDVLPCFPKIFGGRGGWIEGWKRENGKLTKNTWH